MGDGARSSLSKEGRRAVARAETLAAWVPCTAAACGRQVARLAAPPDPEAWNTQLAGQRGDGLVYLAPGWSTADDPGVTALQASLAELPCIAPARPPDWIDGDGPALIGSAVEDWRPDPAKTAIVRGIAGRHALDEWLDLVKAEFGASARPELCSWNSRAWTDAAARRDAAAFPLTLRVIPTRDSTLRSTERLRDVIASLRGPAGCPWDREQTHESLRRFLIEEAHEAVSAIETGRPRDLADELGDVLLQVALHAEIARQAGDFGWAEIVQAIAGKMIRRHPHVFGEGAAENADHVRLIWDDLKRAERGHDSAPLAGLPDSLPSLAYAQAAARRAKRNAADLGLPSDPTAAIQGALDNGATALDRERLGDGLLALAALAEEAGVDLETTLRDANRRLRARLAAAGQRS